MSDYSKGKIYQIRCNITGEIYIGSTTTPLSKRLSNHKSKLTCISRQIIEKGDYDISLLELYPCNNRIELRIKEREWYDKIENINKNKPYLSIDELKDYLKEYYINNTEKIKKKNKEYNIDNPDKIKKKNKEYYINNTEKIKKINKEYYINNKEKITCECGSIIYKLGKSYHYKTIKHQNYLSNIN
jgi:hypothetical protein